MGLLAQVQTPKYYSNNIINSGELQEIPYERTGKEELIRVKINCNENNQTKNDK